MDVSVIIPCRNEKPTIQSCIKSTKQAFKGRKEKFEIIVSDSSDDGSDLIAKKNNTIVIKHNNIGYGNALLEGFAKAKGKIIIFADGDGTYDFNEIPLFLDAINHKTDFVIGNRFNKKMSKGAMPALHWFGNHLLSKMLKLFFKNGPKDAHCGFRAIKKNKLKLLNLKTTGMEFASEMIIKAMREHLNLKEVDISYHPRVGESKLRSFRDGWKHLRFMLLYSPNYLFLTPGVTIMLLGILGLIYCDFTNCAMIWHMASAIPIIFGYEILLLGLFSKIYAINYLGENDVLAKKLIAKLSIDKGLMAGLSIFVAGILSFIFLSFNDMMTTNLLLISLVLATLGIQTAFATFFMSILGIKEL